MEQRISNLLHRVAAEQDKDKQDALKVETGEELAFHFQRNRQDLEELAYDLFDLAWSDKQNGDLTRLLVDVETKGLTEVAYIEEDLRGMRAYFQGKGGLIRSDIVRAERSILPREELVGAIDMHLDELRTDFWGMFSKLKDKINEEIRTAPAHRLIELIRASVTSGSTYASIPAASIAAANVDPVLEAVMARSKGAVTIFGTRIAIRKLSNIGLDFGPNVQEDLFRTGQIANYKGYPIVQLENWEDFNGQFALPDDELYIIGRNAGKVVWYGDAKVQQMQEKSFWLRWETARDATVSIYGAGKGRVGRIVLT